MRFFVCNLLHSQKKKCVRILFENSYCACFKWQSKSKQICAHITEITVISGAFDGRLCVSMLTGKVGFFVNGTSESLMTHTQFQAIFTWHNRNGVRKRCAIRLRVANTNNWNSLRRSIVITSIANHHHHHSYVNEQIFSFFFKSSSIRIICECAQCMHPIKTRKTTPICHFNA